MRQDCHCQLQLECKRYLKSQLSQHLKQIKWCQSYPRLTTGLSLLWRLFSLRLHFYLLKLYVQMFFCLICTSYIGSIPDRDINTKYSSLLFDISYNHLYEHLLTGWLVGQQQQLQLRSLKRVFKQRKRVVFEVRRGVRHQGKVSGKLARHLSESQYCASADTL